MNEDYLKQIKEQMLNAPCDKIIGYGGITYVKKIDNNKYIQCYKSRYVSKGYEWTLNEYIDYYTYFSIYPENFKVKDIEYCDREDNIDYIIDNLKIGSIIKINYIVNDKVVCDNIIKVSSSEYAIPTYCNYGSGDDEKYIIKNNFCLTDEYDIDDICIEIYYGDKVLYYINNN